MEAGFCIRGRNPVSRRENSKVLRVSDVAGFCTADLPNMGAYLFYVRNTPQSRMRVFKICMRMNIEFAPRRIIC